MNHIYKVVFNKTTGTFTAVAESAKSQGKSPVGGSGAVPAAVLKAGPKMNLRPLASSLLLAGFAANTYAGVALGGRGSETSGYASTYADCTPGQAGVVGTAGGSADSASGSIAIGGGGVAGRNMGATLACAPTDNSIAIGSGASTRPEPYSTGAVGAGGYNQAVAIGRFARASGDQSVALGADVKAGGNSSIAIGGDDLDRVAETETASNYNKLTGDTIIRGNYRGTNASGDASLAVGTQSVSSGHLSTAFGTRTTASGLASTALGMSASASGDVSVALGTASQAKSGSAIAIGNKATVTENAGQSIAIGHGITTQANQSTVIGQENATNNKGGGHAIIGLGNTAYNMPDKRDTSNDPADAKFYYHGASILGQRNKVGSAGKGIAAGVAVGSTNTVSEMFGVAIGTLNTSSGDGAVAQGYGNTASGISAVAIGSNNKASGKNSAAVGSDNTAAGEAAVVLGNGAQATGAKASVVGTEASATAARANALGNQAAASAADSTAAGSAATASGINAIAIGNTATATATDTSALGTAAKASGSAASAIGYYAAAQGVSSLALGNKSAASGQDAAAIGTSSAASGQSAVALGNQAKASQTNANAIGYQANSSAVDANAMGRAATASQTSATAIGTQAKAGGVNALALGTQANASKNNALAIGSSTVASGLNAIAIGPNAQATGSQSIAVGVGNRVSGKNAGAFGDPSDVRGDGSYSFGNNNAIGSTSANVFIMGNQNAIGTDVTYYNNQLDPENSFSNERNDSGSIAIGSRNYIDTPKTLVFGNGINTKGEGDEITYLRGTVANSVYLGDDSSANASGARWDGNTGTWTNHTEDTGRYRNDRKDITAVGAATTAGMSTVTKATVNGVTYDGFAGTSPQGVVTVGANGMERRIQNVAAGQISATSTDAINGSQLHSVVRESHWKLQENGTDKDNVRSGDVVNFINGNGTTVTITPNNTTDATSSTVKFDVAVDGTTVTINDQGQLVAKGKDTSASVSGSNLVDVQKGSTTTVDGVEVTNYSVDLSNDAKGLLNKEESVSAGDNVTVSENGTNSTGGKDFKVSLNKDVNLTDNGSLTVGGVTINNGGINAGNKPITNVADGTNPTDAVNVKQLNAAKTELENGKNTTVSSRDGSNGQKIYKVDAWDTTVAAADNGAAVTVTPNDNATEKTRAYTIDLSTKTKEDIQKGVDAKDTVDTQGITFAGDTGNNVTRKLGETVNVKGNATDATSLTDGNIGVVANGTDTLTVKLNKDVNLGDTGSLTVGGSKVTNEGVTTPKVTADEAKIGPVTINADGINAGDKTITGVADGVNNDDAVNVKQLKAAKTAVEAGENVTVTTGTGTDGNPVYTVAAKDTSAKVTSATDKLTVANKGTAKEGAADVTNFELDLSQSAKESLAKADTAVQSFTTSVNGTTAETVNNGGDVNFVNGNATTAKATGTGNSDITFDVNTDNTTIKVASGQISANTTPLTVNDGKVAAPTNGDALVTAGSVAEAINKSGWNLKAGFEATGEQINPSDSVTFKAGKNLKVERDGSQITYATKDDVYFDSVTVGDGNVKLTDDGEGNLMVSDSKGNPIKITNIADGEDDNDAVNVSQLKGGRTVVAAGKNTNVTESEDQTTFAKTYTVDAWDTKVAAAEGAAVTVTANDNDGDKTRNYTVDLTAETKAQIAKEESVVAGNDNIAVTQTANNSTGGKEFTVTLNKDVKLGTDGSLSVGPVTINSDGINAGNKQVKNVADGTAPNDAVNVSQLQTAAAAAKTEVKAGDNVTVTEDKGANNQTIYTVTASDTSAKVTAGSTSVKVEKGTATKDGTVDVTDYTVDLSDEAKEQIAKEESVDGDSNITVVQDKTNDTKGKNFNVRLNKDVNLTNDGSLTIGGSVLNKDGLTTPKVTADEAKIGPVTINANGINAGDKTITGVADGVNPTDAVNVKQLKAAKTAVEAGENVTVTPSEGTDGNPVYTIAAKDTSAKVTVSDRLTVEQKAAVKEGGAEVTEFALDLSQTTKDSLAKADTAVQSFTTSVNGTKAETIDQGNSDVNFVDGNATTAKAVGNGDITFDVNTDNTTIKVEGNQIKANTSPITTGTDGKVATPANGNALVTAGDVANAINQSGWKLAADGVAGDELIKAGDTATFKAGENMTVSRTGGEITYATKRDVNFDSVTFGQDGTVAAPKITDDGAGNLMVSRDKDTPIKITNIADGEDDNDAVNVSQLKTAKTVVQEGKNTKVTKTEGADKQDVYTVDAWDTKATAGSTAITVTPTADASNEDAKTRDYVIDLAQATKDQIAKEESVVGEGNITVAENGTNQTGGKEYKVTLNKDVNLGNDGSLTVGDSKVTNNSITTPTVNADDVVVGPVTINKDNGINAGNKQIKGVAEGTEPTDAVNVKQLNDQVAASKEEVISSDKSVTVDSSKTTTGGAKIFDLSVNTDGTTITKGDNGEIKANTTPLTVTDGKVNTPANENALATAGDIANAINKSGWNLAAGDETTSELINPADKVTFKAGDNLNVTRNGADITYGLNNDVDLTKDGSVKMGDTLLTEDGLMINNGPILTHDGNGNFKVGKVGEDGQAAPAKITNLADGEADNDAVNVSQLKAATTEVQDGKNTTVRSDTGANGQTVYKVDAWDTKVAAADGAAVTVTPSDDEDAKTRNYTIDLTAETKAQIAKEESVDGDDNITVEQDKLNSTNGKNFNVRLNKDVNLTDKGSLTIGDSKLTNNGLTVGGNNPVTINGDAGTIGGLTNKTFDPNNIVSGQGATEDQLKSVYDLANTGWNIQANGDTASKVAAGDTVQFIDGKNIAITRNGNDITVATKDEVEFTKVTANEAKVGPVTINNDGINAGDTQIKGVKAGTDGTDAVNVEQLTKAAAASKTEVEAGKNVTVTDRKGNNDQTIYTVNAWDTTATAGSEAVTVTPTISEDEKTRAYAVDLSDKSKESLNKADTALQSFTTSVNGTQVETIDQNNTDVNFVNGNATTARADGQNITFDVNTDGTTIKVDGDQIKANTSPITTEGNKAKTDGRDNLATAGDVVDAINKAGFTLKTSANGGEKESGDDEVINAGDTVDMAAGKNLTVKQETSGKITYSLANDVDLGNDGSVKMGDTLLTEDGLIVNNGPILTHDGNGNFKVGKVDGDQAAPVKITNLAEGTDANDAVNVSQLDKAVAASREEVKSDDKSVTVTTTQNAAGANVYDLSVNTDNTTITKDPATGAVKAVTSDITTDTDGKSTATTPDSLVTAGDVAEAINKSGWNLAAEGTDGKELINPADTVTFKATDNLNVTRDGANITYGLNKDVDLTKDGSLTIGETALTKDGLIINNGPMLVSNGNNLKLGSVNDNGEASPIQIQNVDSGLKDPTTGQTVALDKADGDTLKNAVNVGDLKNASQALVDKGFNITADNSALANNVKEDNVNLGQTVNFTSTDKNIVTTVADNEIRFALNTDLTIGAKDGTDGKDGVDGKIGVNGKDGSAVVINGKDGSIGLNGKDGTNGLTLKGADGAQGVDGTNGANGLPGKDGTTRLVYETKDPQDATKTVTQEVANLNDGLIFTGNNNDTLNRHKLNSVVTIEGEGVSKEEAASFQSAAGNINVEANGTDKLTVKLNKDIDLTDDGSVKIGGTALTKDGLVINNGPVITHNGNNLKLGSVDDNGVASPIQIQGVDSGLKDAAGNKVDLANATGDVLNNAVNVGDLKNAAAAATTKVQGDQGVTVTPETNTDGSTTYTVAAKTDGTTVKVDDKGNIAAVTSDITTNTDGKSTATTPDSLVTAGDVAKAINKSGWNLAAEGTDGKELINPADTVTFKATDNLNVTRDGANITYGLNKDVDLTKDGSLTIGETALTKDGLIINNGPMLVSNGNNLKLGSVNDNGEASPIQIQNVDSGLKDADGNKVELANADGETLNNAVNVSDLKNTSQALVEKGFNIAADNGADDNVNLGETVKFTDPDGNIVTTVSNNQIQVGLNDQISVGGKDGKDGQIGVNGKDGKDGLTLTPNAIVFNGVDGKDGKDGQVSLQVEKAQPALDGKDGADGQTRIVYEKPNGAKEEVATLNDGLKFKGDDDQIISKKLNEQLDIVGGADKDSLTENNIGVNYDNGKLKVQLTKDIDLTDSGSLKIGNTALTKDGLIINNGPMLVSNGNNLKLGSVDGTTVSPIQIQNVESGLKDANGNPVELADAKGDVLNNAVNVGDLQAAAAAATTKVAEGDGIMVEAAKNADGSTTYTVSAVTDEVTTTINKNGEIAAITSGITTTDGKAEADTPDSLITAGDVAEAINASGWNLAAEGTDGKELINPSDTVTFKATDNLNVTRDGANITYGLNKDVDLTKDGSLTIGETALTKDGLIINNGPMLVSNGNNLKLGSVDGTTVSPIQIQNVDSGLKDANGNPVDLANASGDTLNNAVNVGDLQKAAAAATTKVQGDQGVTVTPETNTDGSTTYTVAAKTDGTTVKVDDKGNIAAVTSELTNNTDGKVNTPAAANALATAGDIANAINNSGWNLAAEGTDGKELINPADTVTFKAKDNLNVTRDGANITYGLNKDVDLTKDGSLTIGGTKLDGNSLTVGGDNPVTIDGNKGTVGGLTNTTWNPDNIVSGQAATEDQLKQAAAAATTKVAEGDNITVTPSTNADGSTTYTVATKRDVNFDKVSFGPKDADNNPSISNDGNGNLKVGDANGNAVKITNVADGTAPNDAVNVSQLNTAVAASREEVTSKDGSVKVDDSGRTAGGAKIFDLSVNTDGTTITKGDNGEIKANTTPLTNTDGKVTTPDAADENKLVNAKTVADAINNSGFTLKSSATDGGEKVSGNDELIKSGETVELVAGKNLTVKQEADGKITFATKGDLTADNIQVGEKGEPGKDGVDGTIGVNGKDGSAVVINGKDGSIGLNGKDGANGLTLKGADGAQGVDGTNGTNGLPGKDGTTRLVYETKDPQDATKTVTQEVANLNDGLIFTGNNNDTLNRHKLNSVVTVKGEGVDKDQSAAFQSAAGNINVKADGNGTLEVQLAKDVKVGSVTADTVTAGNTTVNTDGITIGGSNGAAPVSLTGSGLNNGGNRITNVAPGVADTDAVNVGQLKGLAQGISNRIDEVNADAKAGVAQALATAGLPQAYLPGKSMMAVGGGVYRGATGYAVGYSSISDGGNWIIKGTASGNSRGHFGATAAVGYQW
ncbi:YadA-like family protein [Neisseria leonii]|uniref:YadA-like family protein n=1 Tax=Neisseria leonii TaxID=2995413 RepID=UPI0030CEF857